MVKEGVAKVKKFIYLVSILALCTSCVLMRDIRRTAKMDSLSTEYDVEIVIPDRPEMIIKGFLSLDYEEQISAWWKGQGRNGIPIEVNTPIKLTAITNEAVFISVTIMRKGSSVATVEGGVILDYFGFANSNEHLIEAVSKFGDSTIFHLRVETKLLTRIEELDALL